jgi:hypothetical protein
MSDLAAINLADGTVSFMKALQILTQEAFDSWELVLSGTDPIRRFGPIRITQPRWG